MAISGRSTSVIARIGPLRAPRSGGAVVVDVSGVIAKYNDSPIGRNA